MTGPDRWHDGSAYEAYVGRWSRRVAASFVTWLEVEPGGTWIDVGCGTGVLTSTILEFARPRSILAVDPSEAFLATARGAIRDPRVTFAVGTADDLPGGDGSADAGVAGLVLNFVPDVGAALARMRRALEPGGVVGAYVWDYAGEMQLIRRLFDAAAELDPRAAEADEGRRFPICHPDGLEAAFRAAGLSDVTVIPIDVPTVFRDFDDYWRPFLGGVGPAPGYVMSLDPSARERLRARLEATLPREPDGSIALIARAWAARGRA
jgi:SAM-dependent methyltransferase